MMRPAARIAAVLLAVSVGIWAGLTLHHWQSSPLGGVRSAAGESSATSSDSLEALDTPLRQPKIPDRLPEFSLEDRDGHQMPISAFAGHALVINFWATWCAPCRKEMPLLKSLSEQWAGAGITVVGVAVDHRDAVIQFARRFGITYPLLIGDQDALDAAAAFGMSTPVFPFTVFTDRRGEVVTLFVGELHREQAELILSRVADLDQGRTDLKAARGAISEGLKTLHTGAAG